MVWFTTICNLVLNGSYNDLITNGLESDHSCTMENMPITSADISSLVQRLMNERGIGVRELARSMGMKSHTMLLYRLSGKASWKLDDLEPLASSLGTTPGWILDELQGASEVN